MFQNNFQPPTGVSVSLKRYNSIQESFRSNMLLTVELGRRGRRLLWLESLTIQKSLRRGLGSGSFYLSRIFFDFNIRKNKFEMMRYNLFYREISDQWEDMTRLYHLCIESEYLDLKIIQMSDFDRDCNTYTPDGKILQLEYAAKGVENSETIIGVKCSDGIILGAEKLVFSKMLVEGTNRRVYNIDKSVGMAIAGRIPDGRHMVYYARKECGIYEKEFDIPIKGGRVLTERLGLYLNSYTLYGSVRAFGSNEIIASYDEFDGLSLFMLEPNGVFYGYTACTAGRGRQVAKAEFEKKDFIHRTCKEALADIAKILILTHEETKDKKWEIELSWITKENGYVHEMVPTKIRDEAERIALKTIEDEQQA